MADKILDLVKQIDIIGIDKLGDDQLLKLKNKMLKIKKESSPYFLQNMVPNDEYLLALFTPMYRDYLAKIMITAVIGYLNRACDEWNVPDGVPVVPVYDYIQDPSLIDVPKSTETNSGINKDLQSKSSSRHSKFRNNPIPDELKKDYEDNIQNMKKRIVVKEFLEYLFQFDPDEHVRGAYIPNPSNNNRKPIITPASKMAVWMEKRRLESLKRVVSKDVDKADELIKYIDNESKKDVFKKEEEEKKEYIKEVLHRIGSKKGGYKLVKRKIKCTKTEFEKYQRQLSEKLEKQKEPFPWNKKEKKITTNMDDFIKIPKMVKFKRMKDITLHDTVRNILPSADIFHRFTYYFESNYEELINAVNDIYGEKPELDYAIHPLAMVKDLEEARKFRRKYEGDINYDIYSFQKGVWSLVGPYKGNRDKLDFQGSNMPLFEEMFQKNLKDRELGAQIMKKRKHKKIKKQNKKIGQVPSTVRGHASAVTDVSKFVSEVGDDEIKYTDEDESVKMKVIRLSKGGKNIEMTEFDTEYEVEPNIQRSNINKN